MILIGYLYDMAEELTYEQEALRQLDGLIESIVTGNNAYTFESFKADVEEAIEGVYEVSDE